MRTGRLSVASSSFCNQSVCGTMGLGSSCKSFSDVLNVKHMPGIVSAVTTDSSRTQGETDLVVIGLLPNVQILAGTQFTVTGLLGSATFSTDELKLHGSNSHLFGFHGQFKQHTGVLVITAERNPGNTQENPAFDISFELTNAATPQPGHNISLSMTLPSGVGTYGGAVCDVLPQRGTKETNPFGLGAYAHEPTNRILARILIVFDDVCGGCQQVCLCVRALEHVCMCVCPCVCVYPCACVCVRGRAYARVLACACFCVTCVDDDVDVICQ